MENIKWEHSDYPAALRLTIVGTGEVVECHKTLVEVGRKIKDGVNINNVYIARIHARFCFENGDWFLMDNYSTNGTWINDEKLEAGVKYKLYKGAVIRFAGEEVIFF